MANNNWSQLFEATERGATTEITQVANSLEWFTYGCCGLLSLSLFIASGQRSVKGDTLGAILSAIGALIIAIAPLLAKNFIINAGG